MFQTAVDKVTKAILSDQSALECFSGSQKQKGEEDVCLPCDIEKTRDMSNCKNILFRDKFIYEIAYYYNIRFSR